jgi:hypothetical protein
MPRRVVPMTVVMVCLVGLFAVSNEKAATDEKAAASANPELVTFSAVKTERGELIQVSAGEVKFWVPSVWLSPPNKSSGDGMRVQNGRLVSLVDREGSEATMSELSLYLHPSRPDSTKSPKTPAR